MAASTFDSAWKKLERARKHIADLENIAKEYWDSDPLEVAPEPSPNSALARYRVVRIRSLPADISMIAGDAVHNIRASLDHFACAVVPKITRATSFPTWSTGKGRTAPTSAEWRRRVRCCLEGASTDVLKAVEQLQPWDDGRDSLLWVVHELDRIDKHRLLISIAVVNTVVHVYDEENYELEVVKKYSGFSENQPLSFEPITWTPLESDQTLLNVPLELSPEKGRTTFEFDITLGEPNEVKGKPAVWQLRVLAGYAEKTLSGLTRCV